ncbi:MAG: hypothetical protein ACREE1_17225 [Stellaceae bacterium]
MGERMREEWLVDIAKRSAAEHWAKNTAQRMARSEVNEAAEVGHLKSKNAMTTAACEGALAAHPDVRDDFGRLMTIRDELWKSEQDYIRRTLHGPSQLLIELMRRQKNPRERHYTNSAADFLKYLREVRFRNK